jgi:hypothetical protein
MHILGGDKFTGIYQKQGNIAPIDGLKSAEDTIVIDSGTDPSTPFYPGGINKYYSLVTPTNYGIK